MTRLTAILLTSVFMIAASVAQERAPTPEEKAYKFRTSLFQTFSWKFGRLVAAKNANDAETFAQQAKDLAYLANMIEEGFAIENSLPEGSEAKPNIWTDKGEFEAKSEQLRTAALELQADGAMLEFDPRKFGSKNCGGCHREFRIKK